ncbi:hypothetical protein CSC70_05050 [Pseudoxanthomonas kalamensis DSM 18571]|uniref:hypothetical protein n=1 Tax=Pseudoxanthomonas kalamensis TaxID=289483 RepID=UPI001390AA04|nr:hypothetical protein [Pseudoxanthomonas kalamensis]KAF1711287.1 hypothetical protein CSC70_05050 [Pseudoxanthomonas kalamensis DSM 18571]
MNRIEETRDDGLRWQLRALRQDTPPGRDLWPEIAARIAATPQQQTATRDARWQAPRWLPAALAASVLLAVGGVWLGGGPADTLGHAPMASSSPVIEREAVRLARQYETALAVMPQAQARPEYAPALQDLDRNVVQILDAIDHNPSSRRLLEQLRRTYALRLELTQRAIPT